MIAHATPKLDNKGLRNFGLTTGAILAVLFGLLIPLLVGYALPLWPWILAGIFWVLALSIPISLNPIYRGWMVFGQVAGWINNRIVLCLLFFVIFFPVGAVMRIFGRDPMTRLFNKDQQSYRVKSLQQKKEHFERPY